MTSPDQTMSKTSQIRLLMLVVSALGDMEYFSWPSPANSVSAQRQVCGTHFSWSSWYFGKLFWSLDSENFKATIVWYNLISTDLGRQYRKVKELTPSLPFFKSKIGEVNKVRFYGC